MRPLPVDFCGLLVMLSLSATAAGLDHIVVISDDSRDSGGAASVAIESVRQLRNRGLRVTLITGDSGANPEFSALGVDVVSLGAKHILSGHRIAAGLRGLYSLRTHLSLQQWVDQNDAPGTIYHLHNWHKFLSPSVFAALKKVTSRLVLSAHDFFLACPNGGYYRFPQNTRCELRPMGLACLTTSCDKRRYSHKIWRVARHLIRETKIDLRSGPATVLAVHEGMVPLLERAGIGRQSIQVLRNPVSPWRTEKVPAARNRMVLFVGRLELDKGIDTLVEASKKVGAELCIIGDGPLRAAIKQTYPAARLLGHLPPDQIALVARRARLLVAPTRVRETFGLVALEAAMSGIPVLSSESALITEELVRAGVAVSCRPSDAVGLAQQIVQLMSDDGTIAEMSDRGFVGARELAPTADAWCSSLLAVYRQKLERAHEVMSSASAAV
jgi:glycosyltransferase involved in cell wall biosynthesis